LSWIVLAWASQVVGGIIGGVDEHTVERVREVVAAIPPGHVLAYGDVAVRAGLRSARLVGRIMAEDSADLPWHRVLRANGTPAPHIAREQLARLRAEGVLATDGRIPMRRYRAP
jgi:methylated-DNA-protein-cysteine methyltransferase related protein